MAGKNKWNSISHNPKYETMSTYKRGLHIVSSKAQRNLAIWG